jgi:hypothetical protein
MFGRIFGRGKDEPEQDVCAKCGRTLLAGEWTRKIAGPSGEERLICSLCGPEYRRQEDPPPLAYEASSVNNRHVRENRSESLAVSDPSQPAVELAAKDAEIERLREQLARAEAERRDLADQVARQDALEAEAEAEAEAPSAEVLAHEDDYPVDSSEPGERTWGETPAEFAAEMPALQEEADEAAAAGEVDGPSVMFEDTQPLPALEDPIADSDDAVAGDPVPPAPSDEGEELVEPVVDAAAVHEPESRADEAEVARLAAFQRGVDLFNVSRVPRKIAETNEQLGAPLVNVGPEAVGAAITFMWSMGWYRFHVDTESGEVSMADRGYEEITHLSANAGVRADGTVHLAPAQISRAAANRANSEDQPEGRAERRKSEPESPTVAAQKPPEILSKSLLGQRSDDEPAVWEKTKARDFDWDR